MIHYHHVDGGMPNIDKPRFLSGRHGLVSFAYQAQTELAMSVCQSVILDNGAFTAWTKGEDVDWSEYIKWVRHWHRHPAFDFCIIPDVIDGTEHENDALLRRFPKGIRAIPVYHLHESIERLLRLGSDYGYVALGSSGKWSTPGAKAWWERMVVIMNAICDSNGQPQFRLHGLRMLNPLIFTRLPLTSADSINAVRRSHSLERFGSYVPRSAWQRAVIVADRIESFQSAACWHPHNEQLQLL